jgi:hypothetical protein
MAVELAGPSKQWAAALAHAERSGAYAAYLAFNSGYTPNSAAIAQAWRVFSDQFCDSDWNVLTNAYRDGFDKYRRQQCPAPPTCTKAAA